MTYAGKHSVGTTMALAAVFALVAAGIGACGPASRTPSPGGAIIAPGQEQATAGPTTSAPATATDATVYITKSGDKYHQAGCRSLAESSIPISLKDAKARRYTPCSVCRPPG